jgi:hypothetical protein
MRMPELFTPDRIVYHYTSQKGLIGILTTKKIWATSIRYLNDSMEFLYTLNIMKDQIDSRLRSNEPPRIHKILDQLKSQLEAITNINVCVACFSDNGDLLSQWRGYCPDGGGFAIGFDSFSLQRIAARQDFDIGACIYDLVEQQLGVAEYVEYSVERARIPSPEEDDKKRADAFLAGLVYLAATLKHPAFEEEREVRLVSKPKPIDSAGMKTREGSVLIPYFEFNLDAPVRISEIVVGPNTNMDLAMNSVRAFLKSADLDAAVKESRIPYRGW